MNRVGGAGNLAVASCKDEIAPLLESSLQAEVLKTTESSRPETCPPLSP